MNQRTRLKRAAERHQDRKADRELMDAIYARVAHIQKLPRLRGRIDINDMPTLINKVVGANRQPRPFAELNRQRIELLRTNAQKP